ncbi:TPA: hypothetical protein N0F65_009402 [Lagenidium giganteum]|uniref:PCI domain-containing protein n=1 Tax=Lagenidium giganteum TaxID=4803 RepID=A0AAV2ZJ51_9STRA|nr:TPA: hypothetical protein N0F65_009402 [Lagenidium giganteum]
MWRTATMEGELEAFDVEAYAARHSGRARIERLMFIAKKCGHLRNDAYKVLLRDLKSGLNMTLYAEIAEAASETMPELAVVDQPHVENIKRSAAQQHERLEQELNSYKSSMIKESIRMGHNDLGEFYYQIGDLASALKSFAQARDYCTTDKHIVEMCLNVIKVCEWQGLRNVGVHMRNFAHVTSYLAKLEQVATAQNDSILKSKIAAAFGLVSLHERRYHVAALKFIDCQADIGSSFNEVLAAEEIALYGGICALASFDRAELKEKVIDNPSFKAFLELVPWLRELISDFFSSKYAACLKTLARMKAELLLDVYLSDHVEALCTEIRHRAIIQYFYPYLSVDLNQMARAFNTETAVLEKEVCNLIRTGKIAARIDSYQKILYAYQPNKRNATYKRALEVGRKYAVESRNLLLRMNLVKTNTEEMSEVLEKIQADLGTHNYASRTILEHICARLEQLEASIQKLHAEQVEIKEAAREHREEIRDVQENVVTMSTQLYAYKSAMDQFHDEIQNQQGSISFLSTSLAEEHDRMSTVNEKVENHREDFEQKFQELTTKLDDIPKQIAALQAAPPRKTEEKINLGRHLDRLELMRNGNRPQAYTDLDPFTIPEDMKEKIEEKIRQREQSKAEAAELAAAELAEAYKRLQQLSGQAPRIVELKLQMEQCQDELKRAFELIRTSNLQLYSACETKVDRGDMGSVLRELKFLRGRVKDLEAGNAVHRLLRLQQYESVDSKAAKHTGKQQSLTVTSADKFFHKPPPSKQSPLQLTAAQIPELRVSLLELSRNLNLFRHQWRKKHPMGLNPVIKAHMDKIVAMISDAYSATAEEPVDLPNASRNIERVARILASEFSMQILYLMGGNVDEKLRSSLASTETAQAITKYSNAFTELMGNSGAGSTKTGAADTDGNGAVSEWAASEIRSVEKLTLEVGELVKNQQRLEATLAEMVANRGAGVVQMQPREHPPGEEQQQSGPESPNQTQSSSAVPSTQPARSPNALKDDVDELKEQLAVLRKQCVSEETLAEILKHLEQWKREKDRALAALGQTGFGNGQRWMTGAPSPLRRSQSGDFEAMVAVGSLEERPKPQTKLDPLHIHRISGEVRPSRRGSALSKMQARAQAMRPQSYTLPSDEAQQHQQPPPALSPVLHPSQYEARADGIEWKPATTTSTNGAVERVRIAIPSNPHRIPSDNGADETASAQFSLPRGGRHGSKRNNP